MTSRTGTLESIPQTFQSFESADYAIRAHSTRQQRNIHTTSSHSGDYLVRRYYCESISVKNGQHRAQRFYSDPKSKPRRKEESEEEKECREARCNYFVSVRGLKGERIRLMTPTERAVHTCEMRSAIIQRKRTHAVMSKSVRHNPNISFVGQSHNYKLTNAIVQN